jgi:hypothetical protein
MDLLTFLASQPPEQLRAGTKIQITRPDGSVTVLTLGPHVLKDVEDGLARYEIPVGVSGDRPQIASA